MTEILSQNEIDALLTAISTGEVDTTDYRQARDRKTVKIYDFRRPDKFSRDHIRTLQMLHETFARLFTLDLSLKLNSFVSIHVASVDQLTYEEFIRSIPNPTTLAVMDLDPLEGSAVLEFDPSLSFAMIDRILGGQGEPGKFSREHTDIELSLIEDVAGTAASLIGKAWGSVLDMTPRVRCLETNPQFAGIVPPNDLVVLITLETMIGDVEGMTNLCVPYITIERLIPFLSARYFFTSVRGEEPPAGGDRGAEITGRLRFRKFHRYDIQKLEGLAFKNLAFHKGQRIPLPAAPRGRAEFLPEGE